MIIVGVQPASGKREILFFNGVGVALMSTDWLSGLRVGRASVGELSAKFPQLADSSPTEKRGFSLESGNFSGFVLGLSMRRKSLSPGETFEEALSRDGLSDVLVSDYET
ncbi:hypothetical protein [Actinorugispora endophytica]|uniref:Uncharacterized protein n=1 Tax=Actinorugispora endophytica TaxID=1605990 RepID=A0A4R6V157_9ACTN|nr:hypothetical protein [Actinorugispora endophytica]TDQ52248.1 hypothetical protein EV190_10780 [Actinorugispora endophytica]